MPYLSNSAHLSPCHLCTLLQIYNRMWNMCGHMVSWGRWHITKLSPMPHWEGTTRDNEAAGFGWFPEGDQASCWWTSKFQHGWVSAFFTCTVSFSLFIESTHTSRSYHFMVTFPDSSIYLAYLTSAYHFQCLLISFISLYSHLILYHT